MWFHRYEFCDKYRKKISEHIVDRFIRFEVDLSKCLEQDERFTTYYKDVVNALVSVMDGHLLH